MSEVAEVDTDTSGTVTTEVISPLTRRRALLSCFWIYQFKDDTRVALSRLLPDHTPAQPDLAKICQGYR